MTEKSQYLYSHWGYNGLRASSGVIKAKSIKEVKIKLKTRWKISKIPYNVYIHKLSERELHNRSKGGALM